MTTEVDRLSDLPESILIHILSLLQDNYEVVRTSILSKHWQFLWKSVPVLLEFEFPRDCNEDEIPNFLASINTHLFYWRSCNKIQSFKVILWRYADSYMKDIDLLVHFATKVANVEHFTLGFHCEGEPNYELPKFAYKNSSLTSLILFNCLLNPTGNFSWSGLVFLSVANLNLSDEMCEKILTGCPNLETLHLDTVWGIRCLEINSVKLTALSLKDYDNENGDVCLEIIAPHTHFLELIGCCDEIRFQRKNVATLSTVNLYVDYGYSPEVERDLEKECSYFKELLHSVAHVYTLQLGPWCIECLSILELKGWQSPPSSRKYLKLDTALEQLNFPGICSFLRSSLNLETLVIDWYNNKHRDLLSTYTNEDEQSRRFETYNSNCPLQHLKTIEIINLHGPLSGNNFELQLVKYLLKNATVLEKFIIGVRFEGSDVSQDVKMEEEILSFPRSSPHASVIFYY